MNKTTSFREYTIIPKASTNVSFTFLILGRRHSVDSLEASGEIRTATETDVLGYLRHIHIGFFQQFGSGFEADILYQFDGG